MIQRKVFFEVNIIHSTRVSRFSKDIERLIVYSDEVSADDSDPIFTILAKSSPSESLSAIEGEGGVERCLLRN